MQKNLYYRGVLKRKEPLKIIQFFAGFASGARLLLEVFIRKNFGERYFSLMSVFSLTISLAILPPIIRSVGQMIDHYVPSSVFEEGVRVVQKEPSFWLHWGTWYLFLAYFVYVSIGHYKTLRRNAATFDFSKYSLYSGDTHPWFLGLNGDVRTREILLEPAFFFVIGLVLWLLQQWVGTLIVVVSILYSLSYIATYQKGDHFVLDTIDEMIVNDEMKKNFVRGETQAFRFVGRKPVDPELRQRMLDKIIVEEEATDIQ